MSQISILATVEAGQLERYQQNLSDVDGFTIRVTENTNAAFQIIAESNQHVDVLVIDNSLPEAMHFIREIRQKYPRLLIVLVDEEADFGMPGIADEMSTAPFTEGDLAKRISRMIQDRRMETQRSDSLPAMRNISKAIKSSPDKRGRQEAAVAAILDTGFDYVAFYELKDPDTHALALTAQSGPKSIQAVAPKKADTSDLMGWVAENKQSRLASPEDNPNHPLVARGRLGEVACVPVTFSGRDYGVIAACRDRPNTMTQENVMMLELIATQLATALKGL